MINDQFLPYLAGVWYTQLMFVHQIPGINAYGTSRFVFAH